MLIKVYTQKKLLFGVLFLKNELLDQYSAKKLSTETCIVPLFLKLSRYQSQMNITAHSIRSYAIIPPMQRINFWGHFFIIDCWPSAFCCQETLTQPHTPLNFFLRTLKNKIFNSTLENIDQLKQRIMIKVWHITQVTRKEAYKNLL